LRNGSTLVGVGVLECTSPRNNHLTKFGDIFDVLHWLSSKVDGRYIFDFMIHAYYVFSYPIARTKSGVRSSVLFKHISQNPKTLSIYFVFTATQTNQSRNVSRS